MINSNNIKMDLNVRTIRPFLYSFEREYGKNELVQFINKTEMPLDFFSDENNWISFEYFINFLDQLVNYAGSQDIIYKFGLSAGIGKNWGIIKTIITSFTSCAFTYKSLIALSPRWAKTGEFKINKLQKNKAIIEYKLRNDLTQNKNNCLSIQGSLASIPIYYNLPPAKIHEINCAANGAESCVYEISWRNPIYKKTSYYFLLMGVFLSFSSYLLFSIFKVNFNILYLALILTLIIIFKYSNNIIKIKKIITAEISKKESQNESLEKHIEKIEELNKQIQFNFNNKSKELNNFDKELKESIFDSSITQDELIRADKMTDVGGVAVGLAKNLNNPVLKIQQSIQKVTNLTKENDIINKTLSGAGKSLERCENIVNTLFSFSNNGNKFDKEIDINLVIKNSIKKAIIEIADSEIKLTSSLGGNLPIIKAESNQLEQILLIMIINAKDAIEESILKLNKKNGIIAIKSAFINNNIVIEISDTGCGIPDNVKNKIFDPFFSTKHGSKRKGIGLTICYNTVNRIGGYIKVKSIPDVGTTFSIILPIIKI